jgi:two-component system, OmpR family, phosphate regulon response regulator PhoB
MGYRILAVDDEKDILRLLEHNLGKAGFEVVRAQDGPEAIELARSALPDLIILDIMLPNMEGTEVLKVLKKDALTEKIPVVMLTAKGEELDRIVGLELGADDYIIKPFSVKELLLRVNVLLKKREHAAGPNVISAGPLTIDSERFLVTIEERPVRLTTAEFKLLTELVRSDGRLKERGDLVKRISACEGHATFRNIDTHVRRLRMKLGAWGRCIETVRGVGYRFRKDRF